MRACAYLYIILIRVKVDQKKKDQKEKQEGCITITSNRKSGVSEEPSAIEAGGSATIAETTVRMSLKSLLTLREVTSVTLFLLSLEEEEGKKEGEGEGEEAQSSVFTNDGASLYVYEYALHGRLLVPTVISSVNLSCLRQGSSSNSSSSSTCSSSICICTIQIQYYLSLIKGFENGTVRRIHILLGSFIICFSLLVDAIFFL